MEPCKKGWTDRDVVWIWTPAGPRKHVLGATWRILLNRPCAAAMRPVVKLLWPLVPIWRPPAWICYARVWTTHKEQFWWFYRCAKFVLNRCSNFDNMHVLSFCEFGLKMPIHAHLLKVFWEIWSPKWKGVSTKPLTSTFLHGKTSCDIQIVKVSPPCDEGTKKTEN